MTRISFYLIAVTLSSCLVPYPGATSGMSGDTGSATSSASSTTSAPTSTTAASSGPSADPEDPTSTTMAAMNFIPDTPEPDPSYPPYPPPPCQSNKVCPGLGNVCVHIDPNEAEYDGRRLRIFDDALFGCDVSLQDCPTDYKCIHPWYGEGFTGACVPLSPTPIDLAGPCSRLDPYLTLDVEGSYFIYPDNCPAGSQCWGSEGHCTVLCKEGQFGDGECPLPDHFCGVMRDSVYCIENCDPLVQDCPEGETCAFVDYQMAGCFLDYSEEEGQAFDPCFDTRFL